MQTFHTQSFDAAMKRVKPQQHKKKNHKPRRIIKINYDSGIGMGYCDRLLLGTRRRQPR